MSIHWVGMRSHGRHRRSHLFMEGIGSYVALALFAGGALLLWLLDLFLSWRFGIDLLGTGRHPDHPGSCAEDIATALGTGTAELRRALMKLKSLGAVEPKGKARATRYYASAS